VHSLIVLETADLAAAESAVHDANVASGMLADNAYIRATSLLARIVAADANRVHAQPEKRKVLLLEAERDARALESAPPLPTVVWPLYLYLDQVGRDREAIAVLTRCHEATRDNSNAFWYAAALYRRREFDKALTVLDERVRGEDLGGDVLRAFVLAELPDGVIKARAAYEDLNRRYTTGSGPLDAQAVLRLLGSNDEAVAACQAFRRTESQSPSFPRDAFYQRLLEYNCGLVSADEAVKAAKSRAEQCRLHFFIALTRLADGNRAGAQEHFQRSVATWFVMHWAFYWSRMFLDRLEQDKTWPPWIASE
jgi:hypothetical protein